MTTAELPGFELVARGLRDLNAGRESVEGTLLRSASIKLATVGINVPGGPLEEATSRLYALVVDQVGEARAHSRYNALRRRLSSYLHTAIPIGAKPVDAERLRRFLTALSAASSRPATAYLAGGASAVLEGWRSATIDVDLYLEPEVDELMRAIPKLKEDLELNVEFASPLEFLPELPGWRDRSRFVSQEGSLTVRDFDFYSQALSKLERGFDADLADVRAMVERELITVAELDRLLDAITDQLYRFPTVDGAALAAAVKALSV